MVSTYDYLIHVHFTYHDSAGLQHNHGVPLDMQYEVVFPQFQLEFQHQHHGLITALSIPAHHTGMLYTLEWHSLHFLYPNYNLF